MREIAGELDLKSIIRALRKKWGVFENACEEKVKQGLVALQRAGVVHRDKKMLMKIVEIENARKIRGDPRSVHPPAQRGRPGFLRREAGLCILGQQRLDQPARRKELKLQTARAVSISGRLLFRGCWQKTLTERRQ